MNNLLKTIRFGCTISPALIMMSCNQQSADLPHIILVMGDNQSWIEMGYNGHPHLQTPNFDEMARTGLRFDRFYAASPLSSPARGSFLTGRNATRFGNFSYGGTIRPQEITVPEALKTAGYVTGHFGKWHLGSVREGSPVNPGASGFDEWFSSPNWFSDNAILSREGKAVQTYGETNMVVVDAAIEFIRKHSDGPQPLLAVVWFSSPHPPHEASEQDLALYSDLDEQLQYYYGEITAMDRAFGKLREELRNIDIHKNTILWYSNDNGGNMNVSSFSSSPARGYFGEIYDGGILVPGLLEWPERIKTPRVTNIPCNHYDIYPTLLEIAGVSMENQSPLDGISLVPLFDNKMDKRDTPMGFWVKQRSGERVSSAELMADLLKEQTTGVTNIDSSLLDLDAGIINIEYRDDVFPGHAAWLDWPYKLHRINTDQVKYEFYNLEMDPGERNDLFESNSEKVKSMTIELEEWLKSVINSLNGNDYK